MSVSGLTFCVSFLVCLHSLPVVTTEQNFDELLLPKDHVARSKLDNYYVRLGNLSACLTGGHIHVHESLMLYYGCLVLFMRGDSRW